MLILDIPKKFNGSTLTIPLYHRGHLSLFPGATVTLCMLPGSSADRALPEIVISPVHFNAWGDLWRITLTLHERMGLVHDVFDVLRRNRVNVLASESSSMDRQRFHHLEIICDASEYSSPGDDGNSDWRRQNPNHTLLDLRRALLARLLRDVAIQDRRPLIKIRRVQSLYQARDAFFRTMEAPSLKPLIMETEVEKMDETPPRRNDGEPSIPDAPRGTSVRIRLPVEMRDAIVEALNLPADGDGASGGSYYLPVSETKDRFLRVYFIRDPNPVLSATIVHRERVGALATITGALHAAGFDILTSLSRLYQHGREAQFEVVVHTPPEIGTDIGRAKAALQRALSTPDLVNDYRVKVAYPRRYGPMEPIDLNSTQTPGPSTRPEASDTLTLLKQHYENLGNILAGRTMASTQDRLRRRLAHELLAEESATRDYTTAIPRILFISYTFADEGIKAATAAAIASGFEVVTGRKLGYGSLVSEIIRKMRGCTHFLGIWTEDKGKELTTGRFWPSPWLHWELGVAQSLSLRAYLLISNKVDPDAWKIQGGVTNTIFTPASFESSCQEAITALDAGKMRIRNRGGLRPMIREPRYY